MPSPLLSIKIVTDDDGMLTLHPSKEELTAALLSLLDKAPPQVAQVWDK